MLRIYPSKPVRNQYKLTRIKPPKLPHWSQPALKGNPDFYYFFRPGILQFKGVVFIYNLLHGAFRLAFQGFGFFIGRY
jgi:hypothetical protein